MSMPSDKAKVLPRGMLYVGGRWRHAEDGRTLPIINPSTEQPLGTLSAATVNDVSEAVVAARAQFESGEWSRLAGAERGRLLWRLADRSSRHR